MLCYLLLLWRPAHDAGISSRFCSTSDQSIRFHDVCEMCQLPWHPSIHEIDAIFFCTPGSHPCRTLCAICLCSETRLRLLMILFFMCVCASRTFLCSLNDATCVFLNYQQECTVKLPLRIRCVHSISLPKGALIRQCVVFVNSDVTCTAMKTCVCRCKMLFFFFCLHNGLF